MPQRMFGYRNSKLVDLAKRTGKKTATFDLLAGHTCPMADKCHARVIIRDGHRQIQKLGEFMCYAAKSEAAYPATYKLHKLNKERSMRPTFEARAIAELNEGKIEILRIHSSGDFYDFAYFQRWYAIAQKMPHVSFFGYTKQATFVKWLLANPLPNFKLVYSHGGMLDRFAFAHNLPTCYVQTPENDYNVPLACERAYSDDYDFVVSQQSFKIALH